MGKIWKKFISNVYNIILAIIQVLALLSCALMNVAGVFVYFFILLEAAFFVVWGVKILVEARKILVRADQYADLPLTTEEKLYYRKKDINTYKSTKSRAIMFMILGAVFVLLLFYM